MQKIKRILCFIFVLSTLLGTSAFASGTTVSQGQKNIVLRARQLTEIQWTPVYDRWQWDYTGVFSAGKTYTGLPYGQPVNAGYIGFDVSLDEFAAAVKNANSKFYSSYSWYNKVAPYYSIDCSAFVSYAWGLDYRVSTSTLHEVADYVSSQNTSALQVGDCLNRAGVHAVLVTDVVRSSSGSVVSVEIMEATPNITAVTRYGQGGSKTLSQFQSRFFDSGYVLYRYSGRHSVDYVHSCAVPLDGDYCSACGGDVAYNDVSSAAWYARAVEYVTDEGLFVGTGNSNFSPNDTMTRGMFITVLGRLAGLPDGLSGRVGIVLGDDVNLRAGPGKSYSILGQVDYGDIVSVLGWENGWYKLRVNGQTAYITESYLKPYDSYAADLDLSAWYAPYVQWAYLTGICSGSSFAAESAISREDMALYLHNYIRYAGLTLKSSSGKTQFSDNSSISSGKTTAVYALQQAGVIKGMGDGSFAPCASATRAHVAQIFLNLDGAVY